MTPLIPRLHLWELNDLPVVPGFVRERVQSALTLFWQLRVPVLQPTSPSTLVGSTLRAELGARIRAFTYVDFCSGAGGPTPRIEQALNALLAAEDGATSTTATSPTATAATATAASNGTTPSPLRRSTRRTPRSPNGGPTNGVASYADVAKAAGLATEPTSVDFVLTDIAPHRAAWAQAAAQSAHLHYVATSVDAAAADAQLLQAVTLSPRATAATGAALRRRAVFRLFFLAFHHMPDHEARAILRDTLATAEGFAIFELQGRALGDFLTMLLLGPVLFVLAPLYFWRDPLMLLLTNVLPIVPFIVIFDGLVSCLRTRTGPEIDRLIRDSGASADGWRFREGEVTHTWPIGKMRWYIGTRE